MQDVPGGVKYLTAQRLIELLQQLPPDAQVAPNAVGNFAVYHKGDYIGFIDFLGKGVFDDART